MKEKGLGDSIERVARITGLKSLTEMLSSSLGIDDCGCNNRRRWLNNQFPYKH
jgi:hypothetical protein